MMVDKLVMLKPIEYTIPRLSSHVSYGLVLMVCQSRFITHNKCTILVGDADNGESYAFVQRRRQVPLNFAVTLNLSKKLLLWGF